MTLRSMLSILFVGALAACTTGATREEVEQKVQQVEQNIERAKEPTPARKSNPLVVTDQIWAGSSAERMHRGMPLPEKYETGRGIALVSANAMNLSEFVNILSNQINVPVRVAADVTTSPAAAAPVARPLPNGKPAPVMIASASSDTGDGEPISLAYEGPLSGLLDQVASHFGINWRYDGSVITFSKFETRIFMVEALPGKGKYSDKVSGDSGSGGGSSGGGASSSSSLTQETELQADLDIWAEVGNTINAMLAGTGTAVIAPSVGTISVTTTADIMKRIAHYISEQNARMTRQIAINVSVYTADIENENDFNNNFVAALNKVKPFTFAGVIAPTFSDGAASDFSKLSIGIINNDSASGSSVLTALSKVTNNVRVAQFPMTTLNNVPITRRVGRDVAYLASAATTTTGTSGSTTTTLTPGKVLEGFSLQLTPRMLSDGRMLLQYSLNLTDLVTITTFSSGTGANSSSVQLPVTASRVFVQQSLLRSGSTLVLSGYSQDQTVQNANGTLNPYNFLVGGGVGNDKKKTLLLVTITPQELDVPPLEQP